MVDGAEFQTTDNFSAGTIFGIRMNDDEGDWWRSPEAFQGGRGVYRANSPGVYELIYCDTAGKMYNFKINTYQMRESNRFKIPEKIPVGALFSIVQPVEGNGIWGKQTEFLEGAGGTYKPLRAGYTMVTFTTTKYRYTVYLNIVDEELPPETAPEFTPPTGSDVIPPDGETPPETTAPPPEATTPPPAEATPPATTTPPAQNPVAQTTIVLH
jgi:hypothetical protein